MHLKGFEISKYLLHLQIFQQSEEVKYIICYLNFKPESRSSHPEVFFKKVFLKISPNSQENNCAGISFSVKFQAWRGFYFSKVAGWKSATLLKMRLRLRAACKFTEKQASTQVFSCKFLRNFHEKLFCRTPPGHCFLMLHLISGIINKRKNKRRSGYFRYHPVFFCIFDNFYCRDCKRAKFSTN